MLEVTGCGRDIVLRHSGKKCAGPVGRVAKRLAVRKAVRQGAAEILCCGRWVTTLQSRKAAVQTGRGQFDHISLCRRKGKRQTACRQPHVGAAVCPDADMDRGELSRKPDQQDREKAELDDVDAPRDVSWHRRGDPVHPSRRHDVRHEKGPNA